MNRLFVIALVSLTLGAAGLNGASTAYAAQDCSNLTGIEEATCLADNNNSQYDAQTAAQTEAALQAARNDSQNTPTDPKLDAKTGGILATVIQWIASLFAWLVGVAALVLDYSVYFTVIKMGDYLHNLTAIGVAWRILRDIGNIALIFGFLAIGISTILNTDMFGYGKKLLPTLIICAVALNFSLFFAEAVVDVGNLFATQFFTQINGGQQPTADFLSKTNFGTEGISNKIMAQVGLQNIYNQGKTNPTIYKDGNSWLIGFMSIILFIVTAFVMFSLAFILIARFIFLIFLIILSPIGIAGLAIPKLSSRAHEWWSSLVEQTITAPVLLLLLYVALAVITDASFLTGFGVGNASDAQGVWAGFINGSLNGFGSIIITFLVAMGLLIFVVIAAKKLSAFGAGWAIRTAGAASFGAAAWQTRVGVGLIGSGVRRLVGNRLKKASVSNDRVARYASRAALLTGKGIQNLTFDARNGPGAAKLLGALGVDAGTASKMTVKDVQEKEYGLKPTMEWFRNASKEYEKEAAEVRKGEAANDPTHPDFEKTIKKMSKDELSELRGIRKGLDEYIQKLSPAKYAELQKSDKLLQPEKDKIKTSWNAQFSTPASAAATMARFSTEEISTLDADTLKKPEVIAALGPTELNAILRKGNLTKSDRHDIHDEMVIKAASDPAGYGVMYADYFDPAKDAGGTRDKYWRV